MIAATHDGHTLRGVAADGRQVYAAFASKTSSLVEARATASPATPAWSTKLDGIAGEIAVAGTHLAVAVTVPSTVEATIPDSGPTGTAMRLPLRGDPAALLESLDGQTGKVAWQRPFESTEWVLITALAALGTDTIVAGSFGGTLRVVDKVVTSGGGSDGFLARITQDGKLAWLVRMGGAGADGIQGVAVGAPVRGNPATRIAIAGTFSPGADILGAPLKSIDERSPFGDAFVAEFDGNGARRWSAVFGSRGDDAVAGVAIDDDARVIVAANVHEVLSMAGAPLVPRGTGDGLVVWYGDGGELGTSVLVGGNDFDGIRSIAAVGNRVVLGGFFSGTLELADRTLTAGGGDDAFAVALDGNGTVTAAWHLGGSGREEVTALSAVPGGFITGVAHTGDVTIDDDKLAAPPAGSVGAALVVRGL